MLEEYKKVASKLISLKSISADSKYKDDIKKTAEFLKDLLISYGFDAKIVSGYGNPIVLGSYTADPKFDTSLIYGHYDVQPASIEDGWDTDPFKMTEKNGKLFGRGIMDDKCQFIIHVLTIGKLVKEKKLCYNIKFLFEGEEEAGSPHMEKFITDYKKDLDCDFFLMSDDEFVAGSPVVELGTRGLVTFTLSIITSANEAHSGLYGGSVPNAIFEMSKLITSFYDRNNKLTIDGIYDDVDPIINSPKIPFSLKEFTINSGSKTLSTEPGYDYYTQVGLRPALIVTGVASGYSGQGHKNIIPAKATAKINVRIVKSQKPEKIAKLVENHIKKHLSEYAEYKLSLDEEALPTKTDTQNEYLRKAIKLLKKIYGKDPFYKYSGGTEPVLLYIQEILKKPLVLVPFANEDGHMHGINENFNIENIKKGLEFSEKFFSK